MPSFSNSSSPSSSLICNYVLQLSESSVCISTNLPVSTEPIIIIFLGSDKCQARCESSLTFVDYGLTLWHAAIIAQNYH